MGAERGRVALLLALSHPSDLHEQVKWERHRIELTYRW
jgi:hypothetical protein